ncbi:hypothetical protein [Enterococcus faecalis]|uniref:hypothetical protein n=1 Tax=Enterococcus faecalis TaxID=1351 RepID=UPI003D132311
MNAKQFFGKELVNSIIEAIIYAEQVTQEERMILVNLLRNEARQQYKDIVQITLLKLAEHIESLEVSE